MRRGRLVFAAVAVLLIAAASFFGGRKYEKRFKAPYNDFKRDTLVITRIDTINAFYPVEIERKVVDTLLVQVAPDTIRVRDTIYMQLPVEKVAYKDSNYFAVVSGYRPRLEQIEIYQRERIVTITERAPARRWGLGVTAGYGVYPGGVTPYVGVGVTYNLLQWSVPRLDARRNN